MLLASSPAGSVHVSRRRVLRQGDPPRSSREVKSARVDLFARKVEEVRLGRGLPVSRFLISLDCFAMCMFSSSTGDVNKQNGVYFGMEKREKAATPQPAGNTRMGLHQSARKKKKKDSCTRRSRFSSPLFLLYSTYTYPALSRMTIRTFFIYLFLQIIILVECGRIKEQVFQFPTAAAAATTTTVPCTWKISGVRVLGDF